MTATPEFFLPPALIEQALEDFRDESQRSLDIHLAIPVRHRTRGTVVYTFLLAPRYHVCFDADVPPSIVAHHKLVPDPPERFGQSDAA